MQKQSSKIIPTEQDIITSNKGGFGDKIGSTTNLTTSQISLQSSFEPGSKEYQELEYRILCGQQFQQNAIDRIKGIVSRDMPKNWYVKAANRVNDGDSDEIIAKKDFYNKICSNRKPYFFMYNYSNLRTEYNKYVRESSMSSSILFGKNIEELIKSAELSEKEADFIENFYKYAPLDCSPGTINRICWAIEDEFSEKHNISCPNFDYTMLKSGVQYDKKDFNNVKKIYFEYSKMLKDIAESTEKGECEMASSALTLDTFKEMCQTLCLDEEVLCDIVLDLCYTNNKSKQFAWDVCGETIIKNLLKKNNNRFKVPMADVDGEFIFKGEKFAMKDVFIGGNEDE